MIAQITTGYGSAGPLVIPGHACKLITVQNNGTGAWRLSFDGGATNPTTTTGYLLAAGQQLVMTQAQFPSYGPKTIAAIFSGTGSQLLDICTDDKDSTAPGHA